MKIQKKHTKIMRILNGNIIKGIKITKLPIAVGVLHWPVCVALVLSNSEVLLKFSVNF